MQVLGRISNQHLQRRVERLQLIHLFVGARTIVFVLYGYRNPIRKSGVLPGVVHAALLVQHAVKRVVLLVP